MERPSHKPSVALTTACRWASFRDMDPEVGQLHWSGQSNRLSSMERFGCVEIPRRLSSVWLGTDFPGFRISTSACSDRFGGRVLLENVANFPSRFSRIDSEFGDRIVSKKFQNLTKTHDKRPRDRNPPRIFFAE